ncbi:MAG: restriction endonuclease subunit S [Candidatus Moraniibacteriota bacterium]
MKNNWKSILLKDCLYKVVYTNKVQRKDFLEIGEFPIVSQESDFINGYWNDSADVFHVKTPVVIFGDHTQVLKYVDFDFVLGADGVKILQPKQNIDVRYLYYFLQSIDLKSLGYARHYRLLKDVVVRYPEDFSEQRQIVKILDEVFEEVAKAKENVEKNLKNSKDLFESYLQSVFEKPAFAKGSGVAQWEKKRLGDIGKVSMCKRIFKEQTLTVGDIPFYKIGTFGKRPNAYISNKIYNEYRNKFSFPKKGSILLSASGTIGRRVKYDGEPAYFQDSNIVWIDNDEKQVLDEYLYHFYGACKWNATKGATIPRLYNDNLKQIEIAFPKSLAEQKAIIKKLDALSAKTKKLEGIYAKKLADLEELKKSVLRKAFAGEL